MKYERFQLLQTAYGKADKIPSLLESAAMYPDCGPNDEPYQSLWSSLWHQGDIYSASIISVPILLEIASKAPDKQIQDSYHLAISIAITAIERRNEFTKLIDGEYENALKYIQPIGFRLLQTASDPSWKRVAMAGLAFSVNDFQLSKFIIDTDIDLICPHCEEKLWVV